MQVKKFEAPTMQEALDKVKSELGPEAIVLQTRKSRVGLMKTQYEVTVAVSDRSMQKKSLVESRIRKEDRELLRKLPAKRQADVAERYMSQLRPPAPQEKVRVPVDELADSQVASSIEYFAKPEMRYIDIQDDVNPLAAEVERLRAQVEVLKKAEKEHYVQVPALDIPALTDAFEELVISGVDRRHALLLMKKVSFELGPDKAQKPHEVFSCLADELLASIDCRRMVTPTHEPDRPPHVMAFVGPAGSGKTTFVAQMASRSGVRVGLLALECQQERAQSLGIYAKILECPYRCVSSQEDMRAALLDFAELDCILVDTPGISARDTHEMRSLQQYLNLPGIEVFLTLPITMRDAEVYDCIARFALFKPTGVFVSKLDEALSYGGLLNISRKSKLPFIAFSTGQKVPDDFEYATAERVVSLVLNI